MIKQFQYFLIGLGFKLGVADGINGTLTKAAVKVFQQSCGLKEDGVIGEKTLAMARKMGFQKTEFPPKPKLTPLVSNKDREKMFGKFSYEISHNLDDPYGDQFIIKGDWEEKNIKSIYIPELKGIVENPFIRFNIKGAKQLVQLWFLWDRAGLLDRVKTFDGGQVSRFVRGSDSVLSNHAFGSAFDINAEWNGIGHTPAFVGEKGCVRELVPIANDCGFYWGGHFSRLDGMHFELCELHD